MLNKLSIKLDQFSSGFITLLGLLVFAVFIAFILPQQADRTESISQGAGSPDMSYFYSGSDLYNMAETYGAEGRVAQARARFTFDLVFPLTYLFFLATSISRVRLCAAPDANSRWRSLNLFPVFGALFDYLENIAASFVMLNCPQHTPVLDSLGPAFSLVKWFFVNGSFVILVPALLIAVWKWVRSRNGR